jgi:hypothetical protein
MEFRDHVATGAGGKCRENFVSRVCQEPNRIVAKREMRPAVVFAPKLERRTMIVVAASFVREGARSQSWPKTPAPTVRTPRWDLPLEGVRRFMRNVAVVREGLFDHGPKFGPLHLRQDRRLPTQVRILLSRFIGSTPRRPNNRSGSRQANGPVRGLGNDCVRDGNDQADDTTNIS